MALFSGVFLFVRTVTSERFSVGWWNFAVRCIVQKSRPSSNVKVTGDKKNETMLSHTDWQCMVRRHVRCRPCAAHRSRWLHCVAAQGWWGDGSARWRRLAFGFVRSGPRGCGYTGGKICTCCLVLIRFWLGEKLFCIYELMIFVSFIVKCCWLALGSL